MKKFFVSILVIALLLTVMTGTAFGAETEAIKEVPNVKVIMDGSLTAYKNVPISIKGSNLLPLREMLVNLGVPNDDDHIIYNSTDKSVTIVMEQTKILLNLGKTTAYINDKPITLNAAPVLYKNSTYIPIRFVAEALGKKVVWDGSSYSVLICDPAKFESIQQLIKKSGEEAAKAKKYRMEMDISATSGSGQMKVSFGITANAAVDLANKKMYMETLIDMLGMKINSDTYYSANASYTSDITGTKWQKETYTDKEYEELFTTQTGANAIKAQDALCAGLAQIESDNKDETVLAGDVYLSELYKNALAQNGGASGADTVKNASGFNSCDLRMVFDKNTYLIKSMKMNLSAEEVADGQKTTVDMTMTMTFSDYNGDFEITVPQEVLETAEEVGSSTGSKS